MTYSTERSTITCATIMAIHCRDCPQLYELALDSIIEQDTPKNVESRIYICADGPLTDALETLLHEYRSHIYKLLRNNDSIGLSSTLNRLLDNLEDEEYIFRMDGDDISYPLRYRRQIQFLETHRDVELVGCQAHDIDDSGNILGERLFPVGPSNVLAVLHKLCPVLHPTYCMRRSVIENKIYYPNVYLAEDLAFLISMVAAGRKIDNLNEVLFGWRVDGGFFTRRVGLRRAWSELRLYSKAVWCLHGMFSWRYIYPISRFLLRCIPPSLTKTIYRSRLRTMVLGTAAHGE